MNLSIPSPRFRSTVVLTAFAAVIFLLTACSSSDKKDTPSTSGSSSTTGSSSAASKPADNKVVNGYSVCADGGAKELTGAGATFPFPLYSKWIDEYQKVCGTKINYQSVGSGAGIQQITAKTVDYGASDGIMTDKQESDAAAAGGPILHIPMTLAPVVVVVNLPGIAKNQLKMTPEVLSGIYLKTIKKWNDPGLTALNPGMNLPNTDITVVHRSDGSGTTNIFTNYLSKVNADWKSKVGSANSVEWPGDVGGQGNEGVAGQVKQLPGTIGYVELAYAKQNNLAYVQLKNKSGNFIEPTLDSAAKAVDGITLPDDMKIVVTDSTNAQAYPIVSFTWVLAYQNAADPAKGKSVASYLWWSIHNGQQLGVPLDYPGLSPDAVKKAEAEVLKLTCGGAPCLTKAAN